MLVPPLQQPLTSNAIFSIKLLLANLPRNIMTNIFRFDDSKDSESESSVYGSAFKFDVLRSTRVLMLFI